MLAEITSQLDHTDMTTFLFEERQGAHEGAEVRFLCPAHDDHHPSARWNPEKEVWFCHVCGAGGGRHDLALRFGLAESIEEEKEPSERHDEDTVGGDQGEGEGSIPPDSAATVQQSGCTLPQYAEAKRLPLEFLETLGVTDFTYHGKPAIRVPYFWAEGAEMAVRFRVSLEGVNRFKWRTGTKPCLYGLWRLDKAQQAGFVVLVEGESDCHTLWYHNIPALGIPGATTWRDERDAVYLDGIEKIYVIIEPDEGGTALRKRLERSPFRERLNFVSLAPHKDPSSLYLHDPEGFQDTFTAALNTAIPWKEAAKAEAQQSKDEAWEQCRTLAESPNILDRFVGDLHAGGVRGEARAAKLIFLAVTSRLLSRPISIAVKGPSSVGKSYLVEKVLSFFPPTSYYALSAMSDRALAYSEEPLSHRMLVLYEAAGLAGDFSSYLVRTLLSEGRLRYETVEKTDHGLQSRMIEREGPTGLIVTTTALSLHPENETRLFSVPVADTPEQTRNIFLALAEDADSAPPDFAPWHSLQTWLECNGAEVTIPFALALAVTIPPVAVRLRRDVGAVLNLIRAHAILHQATRERDKHGRIIATLEDYVAIRDLVADLVAEGTGTLVPASVRETVQAVAALTGTQFAEVSLARVAKALGIDKSAASRRVHAAVKAGYLENLEPKRGRPLRLKLGDPLPEEVVILPSRETVERAMANGCTVAGEKEGIPPLSPTPSGLADAIEPQEIPFHHGKVEPLPQVPQDPVSFPEPDWEV